MEKSALVYIILTAVTVAFGFLVKNRDYTTVKKWQKNLYPLCLSQKMQKCTLMISLLSQL